MRLDFTLSPITQNTSRLNLLFYDYRTQTFLFYPPEHFYLLTLKVLFVLWGINAKTLKPIDDMINTSTIS